MKQVHNYLIEAGDLPRARQFTISLERVAISNTYCYRIEEVKTMVDLCRSQSKLDWLGDAITGLATTGMRISELASRRWADIDLEANIISLEDESKSARAKKGEARTTKSGESRWFPIHADLREVLERLYSQRQSGPVFRAPRGGILRPNNVRDALIKHVIVPLTPRFPSEDGERGFKDGRLHSFRHFFCSQCADQRVPELMLMNWLGHQSSEMVRYYYRLRDEVAQEQMRNLRFLGGSDAT